MLEYKVLFVAMVRMSVPVEDAHDAVLSKTEGDLRRTELPCSCDPISPVIVTVVRSCISQFAISVAVMLLDAEVSGLLCPICLVLKAGLMANRGLHPSITPSHSVLGTDSAVVATENVYVTLAAETIKFAEIETIGFG